MKTVTLNTSIKNLTELIANTIENSEETFIVTDEGTVVLIDLDKWNNIQERLQVLKDSQSIKAYIEAGEI